MLIRLVECDLQSVMKLGNGTVAPHEQTTPDLRADPT